MRLVDIDAVLDRYRAEYKQQDICDGDDDLDWHNGDPTVYATPAKERLPDLTTPVMATVVDTCHKNGRVVAVAHCTPLTRHADIDMQQTVKDNIEEPEEWIFYAPCSEGSNDAKID